jgi:hypothetical protein
MRRGGLSRRAVAPGTGNVFGPAPRVAGGPSRWGRKPLAAALGITAVAAAAAVRGLRR